MKQCITQDAEGVQQNMERNEGIYVPPGLHKPRTSLVNIKAKVDTSIHSCNSYGCVKMKK